MFHVPYLVGWLLEIAKLIPHSRLAFDYDSVVAITDLLVCCSGTHAAVYARFSFLPCQLFLLVRDTR